MKKVLHKITSLFWLASLAMLVLVILTIADARIARDKRYLNSTLLDIEATINRFERTQNSDIGMTDKFQEEAIQTIFQTVPSAKYTIYAVVMKDDGETIALTKNNIQNFVVNGGVKGQEYVALLDSIANGKTSYVTVNGFRHLAQALEEKSYFIVAYKDNADLKGMLIKEVVIILTFVVICSAIIVFTCRRTMNKYVFDDLNSINNSVQELLQGNYSVGFQDPLISELTPLVAAMNELKKLFLYKTDRMDRMLHIIGQDIGVFECLNDDGLAFYTNTLWSVLELDRQEEEAFVHNTSEFRKFINSLNNKKNEKGIVFYKDKYLEVYAEELEETYIGVVIDRTREEIEKKDLLNTLEKQLQKGLNDYLTGIHNREGFKKKVESFICDDTSRGTLLIFDLDNFKRINDSLGHPEGDKVLQLFANCIKRQFRNSDVLGRLGGDEFVVFLPNQMEITVLRRKLDAVMEDVNMLFSVYKKYELGVSIGAGMISHEINDYELLYGVADSALYVAKRMGKNRYFINSEGIMCMKKTCDHCRIHCPRREALEKIAKSEKR